MKKQVYYNTNTQKSIFNQNINLGMNQSGVEFINSKNMINKEELRIGNKVKQGHATLTVRQLGRNVAYCSDYNLSGTCTYEKLEPIFLTPIILGKCGFRYKPCKASGADEWQGMGIWSLGEDSQNKDFILRGGFGKNPKLSLKLSGWINSNIETLHHLQNLFFSITNKELEYTP